MRRLVLSAAIALAGCTLPQQLLWWLIPADTVPVFFANLKGLETPVRDRLAELEGKRDWQGMLTLAEEALIKDQRRPEWWLVKGYALEQLGRWPEAATAYAGTVQFDPLDLEGWFRLAEAQRRSDNKDKAINTLERSLQVSRESPVAFFMLGEVHREQRNFRAATPAYRESLRLNPDQPLAWYGLGLIATAEGRMDDRKAIIDRLQALAPDLAKQLALQR
jgi:cytochrome c-type biogenesis protein CcmH/NrfG